MKELSVSGGSGKDRRRKEETEGRGHSGVSAEPGENESESRDSHENLVRFRFGNSVREDAVLAQPSRRGRR